MSKIPRWGIHNQIKYSPRRSLLKICPQCNTLFIKYNRGYRIYCCDVCRTNAHREQKRHIDKKIHEKRDKYEHAEQRRKDYAQGLRSERTWKPGTIIIPNPKLKDGKTEWKKYHESLAYEMRKVGMTTLLYDNDI